MPESKHRVDPEGLQSLLQLAILNPYVLQLLPSLVSLTLLFLSAHTSNVWLPPVAVQVALSGSVAPDAKEPVSGDRTSVPSILKEVLEPAALPLPEFLTVP